MVGGNISIQVFLLPLPLRAPLPGCPSSRSIALVGAGINTNPFPWGWQLMSGVGSDTEWLYKGQICAEPSRVSFPGVALSAQAWAPVYLSLGSFFL